MAAQDRFSVIVPLCMVIFIDTLSGSLLIPLLPALFVSSPDSIVLPDVSATSRYFLYGLTQAIVFIAMFFSSPILGDLSDRLGRKKIMMISLLGAFIAYLISVVAIFIHAVSLLLMGRLIAGFTAGSMSAAKAAIIDISSDKVRTKNIGYILLAVSLGSILGPLIAGTLSNSHWVSWFHLTTPLYFAAGLSFLNLIYLYFGFKENYTPSDKQIHIFSGLAAFSSAFTIFKIRGLTMTFLFMQLGWAAYIQFIPLFLSLRYHFSTTEMGVYMACLGVGFTLAFCYLLDFVSTHYPLRKIAKVSIGLILVFIFVIVAIDSVKVTWILSVPAATSLAISYSVLISLFSEAVDKEQQGWIMGVTGAISAFSFGASGLLAGILVDLDPSAPIWLSLALLFISFISIHSLSSTSK